MAKSLGTSTYGVNQVSFGADRRLRTAAVSLAVRCATWGESPNHPKARRLSGSFWFLAT